jgi:transcriptional regulator of aromatic amino acid metabolism
MEFFSIQKEEPREAILNLMNHVGQFLGGVMDNLKAYEAVQGKSQARENEVNSLIDHPEFKDLISAFPHPVVMVDAQGNISASNEEMTKLSGKDSVDEVLSIVSYIPEDSFQSILKGEKVQIGLQGHAYEITAVPITDNNWLLIFQSVFIDAVQDSDIDEENERILKERLLAIRSGLV